MSRFRPLEYRTDTTFRRLETHPAASEGPAAAPGPVPVDLESMLAQARLEGLEQGRAEGRAESDEAIARADAVCASLLEVLPQVENLRTELVRGAAQDVGVLIREVLARVLTAAFRQGDVVASLVEEALAAFPDQDAVTIRVPEECAEHVKRALGPAGDQVIGDPKLEGGCVVQTRHSAIESTLEAAMVGLTDVIDRWDEP